MLFIYLFIPTGIFKLSPFIFIIYIYSHVFHIYYFRCLLLFLIMIIVIIISFYYLLLLFLSTARTVELFTLNSPVLHLSLFQNLDSQIVVDSKSTTEAAPATPAAPAGDSGSPLDAGVKEAEKVITEGIKQVTERVVVGSTGQVVDKKNHHRNFNRLLKVEPQHKMTVWISLDSKAEIILISRRGCYPHFAGL